MRRSIKIVIVFATLIILSSSVVFGVYAILNESSKNIKNNIIFEASDIDLSFETKIYKIKQNKEEDVLLTTNPNQTLDFTTNDVFLLENNPNKFAIAYTIHIKVINNENNFDDMSLKFEGIVNGGAEIKIVNFTNTKPTTFDEMNGSSETLIDGREIDFAENSSNSVEIMILIYKDITSSQGLYQTNIGFKLQGYKKEVGGWSAKQ